MWRLLRELLQRAMLELADALARHAQDGADLVEELGLPTVQAVAHLDDEA